MHSTCQWIEIIPFSVYQSPVGSHIALFPEIEPLRSSFVVDFHPSRFWISSVSCRQPPALFIPLPSSGKRGITTFSQHRSYFRCSGSTGATIRRGTIASISGNVSGSISGSLAAFLLFVRSFSIFRRIRFFFFSCIFLLIDKLKFCHIFNIQVI